MNGLIFCLGALIVVAALLVLARALFFLVHVDGWSMYPALEDGDHVLALRHRPAHRLHKGQIVVWELPPGPSPVPGLSCTLSAVEGADSNRFIKRITGLPGDTVIVLTPELRWPPGLAAMRQDGQISRVWHIPPGHCFLQGDSFGLDSTSLGPLPFHCIRGIVLAKLWRRPRRPAYVQKAMSAARQVEGPDKPR